MSCSAGIEPSGINPNRTLHDLYSRVGSSFMETASISICCDRTDEQIHSQQLHSTCMTKPGEVTSCAFNAVLAVRTCTSETGLPVINQGSG